MGHLLFLGVLSLPKGSLSLLVVLVFQAWLDLILFSLVSANKYLTSWGVRKKLHNQGDSNLV